MPDTMPEGMKGVLGWILGVAIAAFILLIMAIIFGNLYNNTGLPQTSSSFANETINLTVAGEIPAGADDRTNGAILSSSVIILNATDGIVIESGNYTVSGVTISNLTSTFEGLYVNVSYTVFYDTQVMIDTDNIILNYTQSATNTSAQFPTVGTIIGIAILLLILIGLLIFAIRKMMGVAGTTGSLTGSGSSKFRGSSREFS